jgi:small-conductance mechanosensitive channel
MNTSLIHGFTSSRVDQGESIQWSTMAKADSLAPKRSLKREWIVGILAACVAFVAVGLGRAYGKVTQSSTHAKVIVWSAAVLLLLAGAYAVRHLARAAGRTVARQASLGAVATIRLVATGVGYIVVIFSLFGVLGVSLQHLLIGAGLAGVILGIAAQQSLGNIFASIVLLFARPFVVGDDIRIRSGTIGVVDATVMGIGLTYVTVRSENGTLKIPNSVMLASGIEQPRAATPESNPAPAPPTTGAHETH